MIGLREPSERAKARRWPGHRTSIRRLQPDLQLGQLLVQFTAAYKSAVHGKIHALRARADAAARASLSKHPFTCANSPRGQYVTFLRGRHTIPLNSATLQWGRSRTAPHCLNRPAQLPRRVESPPQLLLPNVSFSQLSLLPAGCSPLGFNLSGSQSPDPRHHGRSSLLTTERFEDTKESTASAPSSAYLSPSRLLVRYASSTHWFLPILSTAFRMRRATAHPARKFA